MESNELEEGPLHESQLIREERKLIVRPTKRQDQNFNRKSSKRLDIRSLKIGTGLLKRGKNTEIRKREKVLSMWVRNEERKERFRNIVEGV